MQHSEKAKHTLKQCFRRDAAWKAGVTPWDAQDGNVRPPLKELIENKKFPIPRTGRAIVPGCGRGCE
jgi:hypothetical protein